MFEYRVSKRDGRIRLLWYKNPKNKFYLLHPSYLPYEKDDV
jgi:hypothetical protein